jgi:hypothetical protein
MREIKFRQRTLGYNEKKEFHYWGFIDGAFIAPCGTPEKALEDSEKYTGCKDKNLNPIYEGDLVQQFTGKCQIGEVYWDNYQWNVKGSRRAFYYGIFEVIGSVHEGIKT